MAARKLTKREKHLVEKLTAEMERASKATHYARTSQNANWLNGYMNGLRYALEEILED